METFTLARIKKSYPYSYNLPKTRKYFIVIKKLVFINNKKYNFIHKKKERKTSIKNTGRAKVYSHLSGKNNTIIN